MIGNYPPRGGPTSDVTMVSDMSEVGAARRTIVARASALGLDETQCGTVAIIVTELATNLARHAREGRLVTRPLTSRDEVLGIEMLSVDAGPGMANVAVFLRDGYSTAGTAGKGLGAVQRMADEFDIHSAAGIGTTIMARVLTPAAKEGRRADALDTGVVCRPITGELACGDAWLVRSSGARTLVAVVDGLGHGVDAAIAADAAIASIDRTQGQTPAQIVQAAHGALRATRGAALSVAELDATTRQIRFVGVGNVGGVVMSSDTKTRAFVNSPGIVGHQLPRLHELTYDWPAGGTVVLFSDGITARWHLDRYPTLGLQRAPIVAATLARDYTRGRDDMTVLAVAETRASALAPEAIQ
jgi:anti-sigma regulatory factor (Ser/Thr protein kinase)